MMRRLIAYIGSVRFFILIAVLLAAGAAAATMVPGFDQFYSSPVFLALGVLLMVSLLLCSLSRVSKRVSGLRVARTRAGAVRNGTSERMRGGTRLLAFAPDVIHLGVILLIAGGMLSFALSERSEILLPVGSETTSGVSSSGTNTIEVVDAAEIRDSGGLLLNWYVSLEVNGQPVRVTANHPVRHEGLRFHFMHFEETSRAQFEEGETLRSLVAGEGLIGNEVALILMDTDERTAVFAVVPVEELDGSGPAAGRWGLSGDTELVSLTVGDSVGPFRLVAVDSVAIAGFSVSRDPGRPVILGGLLVLAIGMAGYFFKRWRSHG
jgi:hypothetical protein